MSKRTRWGFCLIAGLILSLTACEVIGETPSPAAPQNEEVLGLPTRTVKPIVSFTPRFTATPIPSITPTPSNTPYPTDTSLPPTLTSIPSPTITPTVGGMINSKENVNLRQGPGFDYEVALSVPPETELGVLSLQTDARGFDWYEVSYAAEGTPEHYWVRTNLVDTNFEAVAQASAGATPRAPGTPAPNRTLAPTPEPNSINILAYCQEKDVRSPVITTQDKVNIWWNWYVARPEYMQEHLDNASYTITLDKEPLDNWRDYASEIKLEDGVWIVYWYYPVGKLSAGEHTVKYLLTWKDAISDGFKRFGPGTANETNEGSCNFTVKEP